MSLYEERMAVLSTGHLPHHEAQLVEQLLKEGDLTGMTRDEGWLLYVRRCSDRLPILTFILGFAAGQGCTWVLFDCDAEPSDEFELHDW